MPKLIRLINTGLLLLLAAPWAAALELGELQVRSRLGQPFVAEIAVAGDLHSQIGPDCVRLVQPLADSALPGLQGIAIYYVSGPQGGTLRLLGSQKVLDPALQVSVQIGCGANLQRDYLIVLDLPAGPGQDSPATARAPAVVAPERPIARAPASQARPAPAAAATPKAATRVSPPSQVVRPAAPPAVTQPSPTQPEPAQAPVPAAALPASPPPATAAALPAPAAPPAPEDGSNPWISLGLILLIVSLLLAIWYQHRRNMALLAGASAPLPPDDRLEEDRSLQRPLPTPPAAAGAPAAPTVTSPAVTSPAVTSPAVTAPAAKPQEEDMPLVPAQLQCEYLMDLTDVMLSFGETQRALKTLQDFVLEHPDEALAPWLRLLELMKVHGKREEFEDLARKVHKAFNVPAPAWEEPAASGPATSLEDYAHVRKRLQDTWGSQACLDYLDTLMRDNRGGQRRGFPLPVMEEVILLRDTLGQRLQNP
jgi:hypothetical protein